MSQHRLFVGRGQALQELPDLRVATDGIGEEVEDLACQGINFGVHDAQLCSSQFNYFTSLRLLHPGREDNHPKLTCESLRAQRPSACFLEVRAKAVQRMNPGVEA